MDKRFETLRVIEGTSVFDRVVTLYNEAFPPEEQYPLDTLVELARREGVDFLAYFDGGEFCGFTFSVASGEYFYLLFLAVEESLRCRGIGAAILAQLGERHPGKMFVLDIEPPDPSASNNGQRARRVRFYERNGYSFTGFEKTTSAMVYAIMCTSDAFDGAAFEDAIGSVAPEIMPGEVRRTQTG